MEDDPGKMTQQHHLPMTQTNALNELPVIGYPRYAYRTLGSSGETLRVAWRKCEAKSCFDVHENTILGRDRRFFDFGLSHPRTFHLRRYDRWNRLGNPLSCWQTKPLVVDEMYADVCHRFIVSLGTRTFALEFCVGFVAVGTFQPGDWGLSPWPLLMNEVKNSRLKCTHVHKSRERRKIAGPFGFQLRWLNLYKKGDFIKKPRIVIMMSRGPLTKRQVICWRKKTTRPAGNKARLDK